MISLDLAEDALVSASKDWTVKVWPLDGSRLSMADVSAAAVDVSGCTSVAVLL